MKHILSVLVENKSGVLSRVTGMISRRGFNIESLTVAPTEDESLSRMTIIVEADEVGFEQITKQLHKLVSVYKISDFTDTDVVERELVLFKVQASPERRHHRDRQPLPRQGGRRGQEHAHHRGHRRRQQAGRHGEPLPRLRHPPAHAHRHGRHGRRRVGASRPAPANVFRAKVVDVGKNTLTVEATGTPSKLDAMEDLFRGYGIRQLTRTGKIAMSRGAHDHDL